MKKNITALTLLATLSGCATYDAMDHAMNMGVVKDQAAARAVAGVQTIHVVATLTPSSPNQDRERLNQWAAEQVCAGLGRSAFWRAMVDNQVADPAPMCRTSPAAEGRSVRVELAQESGNAMGRALALGKDRAVIRFVDPQTGKVLAEGDTPRTEQNSMVGWAVAAIEHAVFLGNQKKPGEPGYDDWKARAAKMSEALK